MSVWPSLSESCVGYETIRTTSTVGVLAVPETVIVKVRVAVSDAFFAAGLRLALARSASSAV